MGYSFAGVFDAEDGDVVLGITTIFGVDRMKQRIHVTRLIIICFIITMFKFISITINAQIVGFRRSETRPPTLQPQPITPRPPPTKKRHPGQPQTHRRCPEKTPSIQPVLHRQRI